MGHVNLKGAEVGHRQAAKESVWTAFTETVCQAISVTFKRHTGHFHLSMPSGLKIHILALVFKVGRQKDLNVRFLRKWINMWSAPTLNLPSRSRNLIQQETTFVIRSSDGGQGCGSVMEHLLVYRGHWVPLPGTHTQRIAMGPWSLPTSFTYLLASCCQTW